MDERSVEIAARVLRSAGAVVVTAGAGMSVDSGLPDFRGDEGFWKAYPMLGQRGLNFIRMANPTWFAREPSLAWGFYGHRHALYRDTTPHDGYRALLSMRALLNVPFFVYTSNVDGHFLRAGFQEDEIVECHGSIHHFQCLRVCREDVWEAGDVVFDVCPDTLSIQTEPPLCPFCGRLARPAVLMFGDGGWVESRTRTQMGHYADFIRENSSKTVAVIEVGAGVHVPNVRNQSERLARSLNATLIRINPRDLEGPAGMVPLRSGARDALVGIEEALRKL